MSKYTKGPWKYTTGPNLKGQVLTESNFIVADCLGFDAQLIAAAPELLEALQYAEKYIHMAVSEGALANCALPVSNIQRMILGVLKKAQGEE